jgi:hypothetical protein
MLEFFKFTETDEFEGETWNFYMPLTDEQEARIRELVAATDEPVFIEYRAGNRRRGRRFDGLCRGKVSGSAVAIWAGLLMKRANRTAVRETAESRPDISSALS